VSADPADKNIALFDAWTVYLDPETMEPLPPEEQGEHVSFAVDRSTYKYVARGGSDRTGYYTFPVGNVLPMDYPMWDDIAEEQNDAEYLGKEGHRGTDTYVFEMRTVDAETDGGNLFIPVYNHPGTVYLINRTMRWYVDVGSGFPVDVYVNETFRVASGGPFQGVAEEVGWSEWKLDNETVDTMIEISAFFTSVLIPLSGTETPLMVMELEYTDEMVGLMAEYASQTRFILGLFEYAIPLLLVSFGAMFIVVPVINRNKVKDDEKRVPEEPLPVYYYEPVDTWRPGGP